MSMSDLNQSNDGLPSKEEEELINSCLEESINTAKEDNATSSAACTPTPRPGSINIDMGSLLNMAGPMLGNFFSQTAKPPSADCKNGSKDCKSDCKNEEKVDCNIKCKDGMVSLDMNDIFRCVKGFCPGLICEQDGPKDGKITINISEVCKFATGMIGGTPNIENLLSGMPSSSHSIPVIHCSTHSSPRSSPFSHSHPSPSSHSCCSHNHKESESFSDMMATIMPLIMPLLSNMVTSSPRKSEDCKELRELMYYLPQIKRALDERNCHEAERRVEAKFQREEKNIQMIAAIMDSFCDAATSAEYMDKNMQAVCFVDKMHAIYKMVHRLSADLGADGDKYLALKMKLADEKISKQFMNVTTQLNGMNGMNSVKGNVAFNCC